MRNNNVLIKERYEEKDLQEKTRQIFLQLIKNNPKCCIILNGTENISILNEKIESILNTIYL